MQARVVVFPIRGRAWCFARPRATAPAKGGDGALPPPRPPPTLKDLWREIAGGGRTAPENAEAVVDFVADKMNTAWIGFGSAPEGSMKNRIHSFGLKLLSRVRPSETLLKSVTKDVSTLEIVHPVLPLPNIAFFWVLFRAYSHWRALQGSERLQLLVSDCSGQWEILLEKNKEMSSRKDGNPCENAQYAPWNLQPSKKLDGFLQRRGLDEGLDCDTISSICQAYDLDKIDVLKYRDLE